MLSRARSLSTAEEATTKLSGVETFASRRKRFLYFQSRKISPESQFLLHVSGAWPLLHPMRSSRNGRERMMVKEPKNGCAGNPIMIA